MLINLVNNSLPKIIQSPQKKYKTLHSTKFSSAHLYSKHLLKITFYKQHNSFKLYTPRSTTNGTFRLKSSFSLTIVIFPHLCNDAHIYTTHYHPGNQTHIFVLFPLRSRNARIKATHYARRSTDSRHTENWRSGEKMNRRRTRREREFYTIFGVFFVAVEFISKTLG